METIAKPLIEAWRLLLESAPYMLFGILVSGALRIFLNPEAVAQHLGRGRFSSVFKAALIGIPIPLCSCGVLPAAAALKKQGATNGATAAFLIATPESGVDSIAVSYALLDPLMTIMRPVSAFITAFAAGTAENLIGMRSKAPLEAPVRPRLMDACCERDHFRSAADRRFSGMRPKMADALRYAVTEVWQDMAGWFFLGLLLAGIITTAVPSELLTRYLGGGMGSMLFMLIVGIPLYICATASTPIAAAMILSGVSPGAALVFLLVGPATNVTSLTVLTGLLGRRATAVYLVVIALSAVSMGLSLDWIYHALAISAQASVGRAADIVPAWAQWPCAVFLICISLGPAFRRLHKKPFVEKRGEPCSPHST